jgi:Zn-finger nucleic acid-binding protein
MQCPVCESKELVMAERQGIEIDYCPQCRGVWLDRGELDKIIDRSQAEAAPAQQQPMQQQPIQQQQPQYQAPPPGRDYSHGYSQPYHGHYKQKKRKGLLSEIFDF